MNWIKVESSNIDSIAWENDVLGIKFKHGGIYEYSDVEKEVFDQMLAAESKGKFFHANIRGKYQFVKTNVEKVR